jgi:hypothetical protein
MDLAAIRAQAKGVTPAISSEGGGGGNTLPSPPTLLGPSPIGKGGSGTPLTSD